MEHAIRRVALADWATLDVATLTRRRCAMPDPSQFNTDRTYPGRWTITFNNPPINMFVPSTIVELGALMTELEADRSVKVVVFQSALDDGDLDSFVDALVRRLASFDREALGAAKAQVSRFGTPTATELKSSTDIFFSAVTWPGQQARRAKVRNLGYGVRSDFELNFGRYMATLGHADGDGTGTQPG
jgi:hypothetical protein